MNDEARYGGYIDVRTVLYIILFNIIVIALLSYFFVIPAIPDLIELIKEMS